MKEKALNKCWIFRIKKKQPRKLQCYLFNFMPFAFAFLPHSISTCFQKSQYFSVSPFKVDFYVGHVKSI